MNADTDPNLMIPRRAFREVKAERDRYKAALQRICAGPGQGTHPPAYLVECYRRALRVAADVLSAEEADRA